MSSASKNRIKTRLWHYLMQKGPQPYAQMIEDLDWLDSPNRVTQMLSRSYLFEIVGYEKTRALGGGGQMVAVWGALPLEVATKQFLEPARKHHIRPLSKQPAFVRKYVEEKLDEQNK